MRQNRQYHFSMNYLKLFGVLTGVGVDVSKFFAVEAGAEVLKRGAGAELESEKCDSAHLWCGNAVPTRSRTTTPLVVTSKHETAN